VALVSCLGEVVDAARKARLGSPALVVVGEVVRFAAGVEGFAERRVA
jgi:siroheme synthase